MKIVTYEDYTEYSGESELNIAQLLDLFEIMFWNESTFLYFPINEVNLLQIIGFKNEKYLVEITNDSDDMVFLQKYASKEECKQLIIHHYNSTKINLKGFFEVPVNTKTLDEVMNAE